MFDVPWFVDILKPIFPPAKCLEENFVKSNFCTKKNTINLDNFSSKTILGNFLNTQFFVLEPVLTKTITVWRHQNKSESPKWKKMAVERQFGAVNKRAQMGRYDQNQVNKDT